MPYVNYNALYGRIRNNLGEFAGHCSLHVIGMAAAGLRVHCPECDDEQNRKGRCIVGHFGYGCARPGCSFGTGSHLDLWRKTHEGIGTDNEAAIDICETFGWQDLFQRGWQSS